MAVRHQINRYRTPPYGKNRMDVFTKAKRFFRTGMKTDAFVIWGDDQHGWSADYPPVKGSKLPNIVRYHFNGTRWERETEVRA